MFKAIYDTETIRNIIGREDVRKMVDFLLAQSSLIQLPNELEHRIFQDRPMETAINAIFDNLVKRGKSSIIKFINLSKVDNISEKLTMPDMTLDLYQARPMIEDKSIGLNASVFKDKIIINATSWIARANAISDVNSLKTLAVRGLLSRTYARAGQTWLPPSSNKFLVKTYIMVLGNLLANAYQIDMGEQKIINAIFAYFFLLRLTSTPKLAEDLLQVYAHDLNLGDRISISSTVNMLKEAQGDNPELTLPTVCTVFKNIKLNMERFTYRELIMRASRLSPSILTLQIALEYPPYWALFLLQAEAGEKTSMAITLNKMFSNSRIKDSFGREISTSNFLYDNLS